MHELHNNWCKLFIILFNIIRKLLLDIDFKTKYFFLCLLIFFYKQDTK